MEARPRSRYRRGVRFAPVLVALALGGTARAESAELTREFQAGVDAFRLGKYDVARVRLENARAIAPKLAGPHRFLAAVAQAQSRWDDCITEARLALSLNPTSGELPATRKLHDACRASAGRPAFRGELGESAAVAVTANVTGATVRIGGLTYGGTPLAPRKIPAGTPALEVEKQGWQPVRLQIEALPGIVTDVTVELKPKQ